MVVNNIVMETSPKKHASPIKQVEQGSATADIWTIWYAAQYGKIARVVSLLDRHAVTSIDVQECRTRWSALHFACRYGHSSVVEVLVARGANVDLEDWQGNTPLHVASGWGNLRCVMLVLEGGPDVRRKNNAGKTPLDVAVSLARNDHVRLLKDWKPLGLSAEELAEYRLQCIAKNTTFQQLEHDLAKESNPSIRLELQALHSKRQSFGESHPGLLGTYGKLMSLYRDNDHVVEALAMADHGLTLCESIHSRYHLETARWVTAIGELLLLTEDCEQAVHCLAEAFNTITKLKGETDQETLIALENLTIAYHQSKHLEATETRLKSLLQLLTDRYGGGYNAKLFHLTVRLASVLLEQKRVQEAQKLYVQCLMHADNLFGAVDDNTVMCTDALGKCHFLLGEFDNAEVHFKRSLAILQRLPSIETPLSPSKQDRVRRAHSNLAMVAVAARSAGAAQAQLQLLGYIC